MNKYFLVLTKKKSYKKEKGNIFLNKYYCGYDYDFDANKYDILLEENLDYDFMLDVERIKKKILPAISDVLNAIHETNFSYIFWDKILSYWWLPAILRNIYLKYFRIKYLIKKHNHDEISVSLLHRGEWICMKDVSDYILSSWEEKYNLQLWTKVIESFDGEDSIFLKEYIFYGIEPVDGNTRVAAKEELDKEPLSANQDMFSVRLKRRLEKAMSLGKSEAEVKKYFMSRTSLEEKCNPLEAKCYMYQTGFQDELFDKIVSLTNAKARPIPNEIVSRKYRHCNSSIQKEMRDKLRTGVLKKLDDCSDDEKTIIRIVLDEMPMCFLELFSDIRRQYSQWLSPNIKYLLTQHGAYNNTPFLFYAAEMHERFQTELRGIQHGGNYQIEVFYWGDYMLFDRMYCWGKADMDDKFISSAPYKLEQYPEQGEKSNIKRERHFLYIDNSYTPYMVQTEPVMYAYRKINDLLEFFQSLRENVKIRTYIRKYTDEYGWDVEEILKKHISGLRFDSDEGFLTNQEDFLKRMRQSNFCIFNIFSTGWLEALAIRKPLIVFGDAHMFPLRESEKYIFERLYEVKIFHHTGRSAAILLNEICDDVDAWWNEPVRQKVVNMVRDRYWNDFGDSSIWWQKDIMHLVKEE